MALNQTKRRQISQTGAQKEWITLKKNGSVHKMLFVEKKAEVKGKKITPNRACTTNSDMRVL